MNPITVVVSAAPAEVEAAIRASLADQGFGVLTQIDVAAVFAARLGVERPPLVILGACNPTFASRALEIDPDVALLLPCNVTVEAVEGGTRLAAVDPLALMSDDRFAELGREVGDRLRAAVEAAAAAVTEG